MRESIIHLEREKQNSLSEIDIDKITYFCLVIEPLDAFFELGFPEKFRNNCIEFDSTFSWYRSPRIRLIEKWL